VLCFGAGPGLLQVNHLHARQGDRPAPAATPHWPDRATDDSGPAATFPTREMAPEDRQRWQVIQNKYRRGQNRPARCLCGAKRITGQRAFQTLSPQVQYSHKEAIELLANLHQYPMMLPTVMEAAGLKNLGSSRASGSSASSQTIADDNELPDDPEDQDAHAEEGEEDEEGDEDSTKRTSTTPRMKKTTSMMKTRLICSMTTTMNRRRGSDRPARRRGGGRRGRRYP